MANWPNNTCGNCKVVTSEALPQVTCTRCETVCCPKCGPTSPKNVCRACITQLLEDRRRYLNREQP